MGETVAVTGATGFIGSNVVGALAEAGYRVKAVQRADSRMRALGDLLQRYPRAVETVQADLREPRTLPPALSGCSALVHCAGYYPTVSLRFAEAVATAEKQMTDLLAAARAAGVRRMIYTSGLSTIGRAPRGRLADESCPYQPGSVLDPYYEGKHRMEQLCLQASSAELATVALLPTMCIGPGDANRTVLKPFQIVARMPVVVYFPGKANFVDVRAVAAAHVAALERGRAGERYLLAGANTTFADYFRCLARQQGVRRALLPIPSVVGWLAAWASEIHAVAISGRPPLLPIENVNMARHGQHFDARKASCELGLPPTDLDVAIADAVGWYRGHGDL